MSARQKNKHRSRHRTHAVKPANMARTSLAKRAPVAEGATTSNAEQKTGPAAETAAS